MDKLCAAWPAAAMWTLNYSATSWPANQRTPSGRRPIGAEQIRRKHGGAILVVERQRGAERRHRNAALHRGGHDVAPPFLATLDFAAEIIIEQQVHQLWIVVEGFLDLAEEPAANDAAAAPHQRDAAVVEVPLVLG